MYDYPVRPPHPGPPPRRPVVPMRELSIAESAIDTLIDAAVAVRRLHEEAVEHHASIEQFEGAAATSFRTQLVGQLRELTGLIRELEQDREAIAASRRAGLDLNDRYQRAMAAYRRDLRAHEEAVRRSEEFRQTVQSVIAGHGRS